MSVIYTPTFQQHIADAYAYSVQRFGERTAERTYRRVISHIENTLQTYPRTGQWRADISCYHSWIPRTPFVVFYRIAGADLEVLALFNGSMDLSGYMP
jgi:plasmid stabilization system protein ParE